MSLAEELATKYELFEHVSVEVTWNDYVNSVNDALERAAQEAEQQGHDAVGVDIAKRIRALKG